MAYYSVHIPTKTDAEDCDKTTVFTCKDEALKLLKDYKDARLKVFKTHEEALKFSQLGFETCPIKASGLKSPTANGSALEKPTFRAPTKQELIQFRKKIEEDKFDEVEATIWENPRYLVNSGDTPTSLKEGTRYNALHVCAIHNRAKIANLILQTISKPYYVELLHGKKNQKICEEVSEILLDYYLNMPEKGRSETPLHLAVKYGSMEVAEVLTAYSQCKMTPNSENYYPKDIVCSRMDNPSKELKDRIFALLNERYYVPVIRSVDNSLAPVIGEPFSQTEPPELNKDPLSPEREIQAYAGPMNKEQAESFRKRWKTPPRVPTSPISKMSSNNVFLGNSPFISPVKNICNTPNKFINNNNSSTPIINWSKGSSIPMKLNLEDSENGNFTEKKPTENNNDMYDIKFPFPVSTPVRNNPKKKELFLAYRDRLLDGDDTDLNISDTSDKSIFQTSFKERHLKLSDTEKGLEMIGRELAKEQNIDWREYWDFLGSFVDIASPNGLAQLENYLKTKQENQEKENKHEILMNKLCNALNMQMKFPNQINNEQYIQNIDKDLNASPNLDASDKNIFQFSIKGRHRNEIEKHSIDAGLTKTIEQTEHLIVNKQTVTTPYSCVEKSFQVFAKRMTKTILHNIESVVSIHDSFNSELKRLKSLVCSFKDDSRFADVDFSLVHSRFANLIISYLKSSEDTSVDMFQKIEKCFEQIIQSKSRSAERSDKSEQMQCVSKFILEYLNDKGDKILPENLKTESICVETWNNEKKCDCRWNVDHKPNSSIAKRSKRLELAEVSRKLFETAENDTQQQQQKEQINSDNIEGNQDQDKELEFCDVKDDEEEIFWSDIGSDDGEEAFYTPPESPSILELDISNDMFEEYHTYLLGSEPTKRDLDVINALFNVEIDRLTYPHIHRWRAAVLRHSHEERDNFPSPSVVKRRIDAANEKSQKWCLNKTNNHVARRIFLARSRLPLMKKSADTINHFKNSNSIIENNSPTLSDSCLSLSYMNVSSDLE